jgi:hypothetical protein
MDRFILPIVFALACSSSAFAQQPSVPVAAALADTLLLGQPLPPANRTADAPAAIQPALASYRKREAAFKSGLTPPRGATPDEQRVFEQRSGIERVVFCLFDRRDSARIASSYALDADIGFSQAEFIDGLLRHLSQPWLAPYLNLVAGDLKLCAGQEESGRRQLAAARDGGHPLVQFVAQALLREKRCATDTGR